MSLTLDDSNAQFQIRAYKPGVIKVNELILTRSVIVAREQLIENWAPQRLNELSAKDFALILPLKPAILLLGTGEKLVFPAIGLYGELINQGIGVEIMDTSAACRTYNALAAENRNVVAALIIN